MPENGTTVAESDSTLPNSYLWTTWLRKMSRELVLRARETQADLLLTFTHSQIQPGALAQIRAATAARLVQVSPIHCRTGACRIQQICLCMIWWQLTVRRRCKCLNGWVHTMLPGILWLAIRSCTFDHWHGCGAKCRRRRDFIGGWRPEREAILSQLGDFDLRDLGAGLGSPRET